VTVLQVCVPIDQCSIIYWHSATLWTYDAVCSQSSETAL